MERWRKRFGRVWKDRTLILMSLPAVAMQSILILPTFISWVAVLYFTWQEGYEIKDLGVMVAGIDFGEIENCIDMSEMPKRAQLAILDEKGNVLYANREKEGLLSAESLLSVWESISRDTDNCDYGGEAVPGAKGQGCPGDGASDSDSGGRHRQDVISDAVDSAGFTSGGLFGGDLFHQSAEPYHHGAHCPPGRADGAGNCGACGGAGPWQ